MKKPTSDSYDEIVTRRQGEPLGRGARRRPAQPQAPEGPPEVATDTTPEEITRRAVALRQAADGLGVPAASADKLRQLAQGSDEQVGTVTPVCVDVVAQVPEVAARAKTSAKELQERLGQRTELSLLRGTAAQLRGDVKDARRCTGKELREGMKRVADRLRADLAPGARDRKLQDRLASSAQEFLRLWDRAQAGPQLERDKTRTEEAAHAEALAAAKDEAADLRALVALRSGAALGQDEWDRAAAAFEALGQAEGPDKGEAGSRRAQLR